VTASRRSVRRRLLQVLAIVAMFGLLAAGAVAVVRKLGPGDAPIASQCRVTAGDASYVLGIEQAANAATIAAVGKRMAMPDHAITVALATALQESRLLNLTGGDLDSLGIFQQRPSQGWGSPEQVTTPTYAATTFFEHLARIDGWEALPVTEAAQRVQRSAAPDAYGDWETEARVLAQAFTGEVPAGVACSFPSPAPASSAIAEMVDRELGTPALGIPLEAARGWTVASWLVAHAAQLGVTQVAYAGQTWTPSDGRWHPDGNADPRVRVVASRSA
jgi:hypothetical protein